MSCRTLLLPFAALVAVAVVLGVQLASGGADYGPPQPAAACTGARDDRQTRAFPPANAGLDRLTEYVVLAGVEEAACELRISRERLLLALPSAEGRRAVARAADAEQGDVTRVLKDGLRHGIAALGSAGRLPPASVLLDRHAGQLGLPGLLAGAVNRVPDRVVDGLLPTAEVLISAVDRLNLDELLNGINDPQRLETALRAAIGSAALDVARERLTDALRFWR